MECSVCHKHQATIPMKHVVEGVTQDISVCKFCAAKHNLASQLPIPLLTDMLLDMAGTPAAGSSASDDLVCGTCHMHQVDFHKTSLLGCPACYTAFQAEVEGLLVAMHKGTRHLGKIPRRRTVAYLRTLEHAIEAADQAKDSGTAVRLREHLRQIVRRTATRALHAQPAAGADAPAHLD